MSNNQNLKWWQKTIVYEIYPNSFKDSNGDGIGDLKGIKEKLSYIKSLNVGAIWLTPVYKSPMIDNGYDVEDYYNINPLYGDMSDMDDLINEAKKYNIKIVMDLVVNHTSNQCAWFKESSKSKDNKYSNYYIWKDKNEDGTPPTNWRGIFGGSAWKWCEERKQYYLHTFAPEQPDLNWECKEVREEIYKIAKFWLAKGIGGFRLDAVPYIKKPKIFKNGIPDDVDGLTSIHNMTAKQDGILDFLHEFKKGVIEGNDIFTVGEANGVEAKDLKDWVGDNGVFDMVFQFTHVNLGFDGEEVWCKEKPWKISDLKNAINDSQNAVKENGWYPIFFENHDKPRSVDYYFNENVDKILASKLIATMLYTLRGTPFLYEGQEIGMQNLKWKLDECNDLNAKSEYDIAINNGFSKDEALNFIYKFSRDNARTPMQWDDSKNAGFSNAIPWIKVNSNYTDVNVKSQIEDKNSILNWHKKLSNFRLKESAILCGDFEPLLNNDEQIFAYKRNYEDETILILLNLSNDFAKFDEEIIKNHYLVFSNIDGEHKENKLSPIEARVYKRK